MPQADNPYFDSTYSDAAKALTTALVGDPAKAGQIAYHKAAAALSNSKAQRQQIENQALTDGLVQALQAGGGSDPEAISAHMPEMLAAFAQAGIKDPSKFLAPQWAITGESVSGADPSEALVRAAYAGGGHAIPLDLALTPERADTIHANRYAADLEKAATVQQIRNQAPSRTKGKQKGIADIDKVLNSVFMTIPGTTYVDQYKRRQLQPDVLDSLAKSGVFETMRHVAADSFKSGGGEEDARQQILDALHIAPGTVYSPKVDRSMVGAAMGYPAPKDAGFYDPSGQPVDFQQLIQALSAQNGSAGMPEAAPEAAPLIPPSPAAAAALRANPGRAGEFDAKYGPGAAAALLGR